jgi:hypothetical protein
LVLGLDGVFYLSTINGVKTTMQSTTKIKEAIILILSDYGSTMSKDLEQALENLHDEIASDEE